MTEKEKKTLQIVRGLALMMVVLHHVLRANGNSRYDDYVYLLSYIHVQTFFVISGFLYEWNNDKYRKNGIAVFVGKKTKELVLPYFAWTWLLSGLIVLVKSISPVAYGILESKGYVAKSLGDLIIDPFLFRNPYYESLWFVYTLYVLFAINWLISSRYVNKYCFAILTVAASCYSFFCYETSPFIVRQIVKNFQWFYLGRLCVIYRKQLLVYLNSRKNRLAIIVVFILLSVSMIRDPVARYVDNKICRACLYYVEKTLFSICGVSVMYILADIFCRKTAVGSALKYIGDKSYGIYLVHNPWIVTPISLVALKVLPSNAVGEIIIFIIVLGFSLMASLCMEKIRFVSGIFLGKGKRNYVMTEN